MYRRPVGSGGSDTDAIESVVFVPVSSLVVAAVASDCVASALSTFATLEVADFGAGDVTDEPPSGSPFASAIGVIGFGGVAPSVAGVTGGCLGAGIVAAWKPTGETA
jgi:hypothetical protein